MPPKKNKDGLSKKGGNSQKVVIKDTGHEKKASPAAPTPIAEVTAPPPMEGFKIKDEVGILMIKWWGRLQVEMLRAGFKNKHGESVKTQGQTINIEL